MINIVVDCVIGFIPVVGDILDVAFKANLRNLRLMEDHLISTKGQCVAGQFKLSFPPSNVFLPESSPQSQHPMPSLSSGWFGFGSGNRQETSHTTSAAPRKPSYRANGARRRDFQ